MASDGESVVVVVVAVAFVVVVAVDVALVIVAVTANVAADLAPDTQKLILVHPNRHQPSRNPPDARPPPPSTCLPAPRPQ